MGKSEPVCPVQGGSRGGGTAEAGGCSEGRGWGHSPEEAPLLFALREGALLPLGSWGNEGLSGGGEQRGWRPPQRKLNCT